MECWERIIVGGFSESPDGYFGVNVGKWRVQNVSYQLGPPQGSGSARRVMQT